MDKRKTADNLNNLSEEIGRLEKCIIDNMDDNNEDFIKNLGKHTENIKDLLSVLTIDLGFEIQRIYTVYEKEK